MFCRLCHSEYGRKNDNKWKIKINAPVYNLVFMLQCLIINLNGTHHRFGYKKRIINFLLISLCMITFYYYIKTHVSSQLFFEIIACIAL